jgi:hypothetical protein
MDIGSILITLALVLLAVVFIARPLLEGRGTALTEEDRCLSASRAELENVLASLQEMDMDYAMQKILPEDYQAGRVPLVCRGAELMKEIDQLEGRGASTGHPAASESESEIEAEVARLGGRGEVSPGGFCGHCGQPVQAGDRYCVRCGSPLQTEGARG